MMRQTLSEFAGCANWDVEELCRFIDKLHAQVVGRVEVVRCRNCKHCLDYAFAVYCTRMALDVEPDGYCSWAERREQ